MALSRIVADKREAVAARKRARPLEMLSPVPSDRSLARSLERPGIGFILECKKASPSQGLIRPDFDPRAIAVAYAPFADAISVLTDEPYFRGRLEDLTTVRGAVAQPVLCKDFVVDPYQVAEARCHGADAILLMCSVLSQNELVACLARAHALAMDALVEVHDELELDRAVEAGARIIGVNNRNLATLEVDLDTTRRLAPRLPTDRIVVCESGIGDHRDVRALAPLVDAFLVGTALMQAPDLAGAVRELVHGRVKICGLTHADQAEAVHRFGATHGGLVLWPQSPRAVSVEEAQQVQSGAPLRWVGVFVDQPLATVADAADRLALDAVQLHGAETRHYIEALRPRLSARCAIWRAVRVRSRRSLPALSELAADRLLLDAFSADAAGGTGRRFDWQIAASHEEKEALILSGGIDPDNAAEAAAVGTWAIDLSSGVERAPGDKDPARIASLFEALRGRRSVEVER